MGIWDILPSHPGEVVNAVTARIHFHTGNAGCWTGIVRLQCGHGRLRYQGTAPHTHTHTHTHLCGLLLAGSFCLSCSLDRAVRTGQESGFKERGDDMLYIRKEATPIPGMLSLDCIYVNMCGLKSPFLDGNVCE